MPGGPPGMPGGPPGMPGGPPGMPGGPPGMPGGPPPGADPHLWAWFTTVDLDKSGQISTEELRQALTNGNWSHFNLETCRLMIGLLNCF